MRLIIVLTLFLSFFAAIGQRPTRKREENAEIFKDNYLFTDKVKGKYSELILYSNNCLDNKEHIAYTLGRTENGWELIRWKCRYFYKDLRMDPYKVKVAGKRKRVKKENVDSLLSAFRQFKFWELNHDSINDRGRKIIDGKVFEINAFICGNFCTDFSELHNGDRTVTVSSFEADGWQKLAPVLQRQQFILCRNRFLEIID